MPDKWEYPWYASWDLAFHCIPFALDRRRIREASIGAADARMVHAPQRANSRLRVGIQRREPAGACLGGLARVSNRPQAERRLRRPGVSRARVPQADAEFHLVGESQGQPGAEYFPGRIFGARQHRGVRSQRPAAHRRLHQSIGRHQLDGDVFAESDAHRAGARRAQSCVRGHRQQVLRALPQYRRGHELHVQRRRRPVGRVRTSSSTTC